MISCLKITDIKKSIKSKLLLKPSINSTLEIPLLLLSTFIEKISISSSNKIILGHPSNLFKTYNSSSHQFRGRKLHNLILKIITIAKSSLQLKKNNNKKNIKSILMN